MSFMRSRQEALLRGIGSIQNQGVEIVPLTGGNDARVATLTYAMTILGDPRRIITSEGNFTDLLEANNITHRQVRTPVDLSRTTRATMVVFASEDGRPLVVHQLGVQTVAFDSANNLCMPLNPDQELKPFAYEIYASLPAPLKSLKQLLGFALTSNTPGFITDIEASLFAVLFSSIVVAVFNLSIPVLTSFLVGTVLPFSDMRLLLETSLVVLLVALSTIVSQIISSLATVRMESLVNLRIETALWSHMMRLPLNFFQKLGTADLVARVGSISEMRRLISSGLLSAGLGLLFSTASLGLMFTIQSQLATVGFSFSMVIAFFMVVLVVQASSLEKSVQDGKALVNDMGLQAVVGMPQIRVSGSEPFVFEQWINKVVRLAGMMRRGEAANNSIEILARVLTPLSQVIIFLALISMLVEAKKVLASSNPAVALPPDSLGLLEPTQLVALFISFQAAYFAFNSQLSALAVQVANTVSRLTVLWQRSSVVMYATPEAGQVSNTRFLELQGQFNIQSLTVRYPGADNPVLTNINLTIPKGKYTAITGASGCGKTTLMRCLLRLMDLEAGVISVDDVDISELAVRHYRRQIGVVLQNSPLAAGSIYEIVRAGRAYTRDEVLVALIQASINEDVDRMPMGLETLISEGAMGISGGQRQRLSLARALLGQPRILILDEATSALDAPTQAVVTRTLENLPITRIAIAHRLSTIESADQIVVIDKGRISEIGTYTELSGKSGGYLSRMKS